MSEEVVEYELTRVNRNDEDYSNTSGDLNSVDKSIIERLTSNSFKFSSERRLDNISKDLNKMFDIYNQKYGTNLTSESLENIIERTLTFKQIDIDKIELIKQNFLYNYAKYMKFKLIVTLFKTIEKNIDHIASLPPVMDGVDVSQVLSIEKLWYWLDKVNQLIEEFKSDDFDKIMMSLTEDFDENTVKEEDVNKYLASIFQSVKDSLKEEK